MNTKINGQYDAKKIILFIALSCLAFIQIFPLIWLVDFSLANPNELFTSGILVWPETIQWGNYVKAFVDGSFLLYFKNSILMSVDSAEIKEVRTYSQNMTENDFSSREAIEISQIDDSSLTNDEITITLEDELDRKSVV